MSRRIAKRRRAELARAWTPFEPATDGSPIGGNKATFINSLYQVSVQDFESGWTWLSIVRRDRTAVHDWRHLQRIKNDLCGPEREAVELYPAESRLVDTNNQWHLWVLPAGVRVPIGYVHRDVRDQPFGAHRQRPFEEPPPDLNARPADKLVVEVLVPPPFAEPS